VGGEYLVSKKNAFKILANVSKNYRAPTLNDRHWLNAGSTTLLPETSYAAEAGYKFVHKDFGVEQTVFVQQIDQWIQWVPDGFGAYSPRNVKQVSIKGSEIKITWRKSSGAFVIVPYATWQVVQSITTKAPPNEPYTIGKQLTYTPVHTGAFSLQVLHKKYSAALSAQVTGKRYIIFSSSDEYALPLVTLLNVTTSRSWMFNLHKFDLTLAVKNLMNTPYQLYNGRAMPGRNYAIQLTYQISRKTK
jgi:iron complex outermembrane receptor protein